MGQENFRILVGLWAKGLLAKFQHIVDRLNEMLDAHNNITYRTVALLILENLCTHCVLDKDYVKQALLPKVSLPFLHLLMYLKQVAQLHNTTC